MNISDYHLKEISCPYFREDEKVYFLSKEDHPSDEIISKKMGELEELLKEKWILSERQENDIGLLPSFLCWFDNHYPNWLNSNQINFKGLEHGFIIRENGCSYVIIPKEFEVEFSYKLQEEIIKKLGDEKGLEWASKQGEAFRLKFNQNKIRSKQAEIIFLTNLESEI